MHFNWFLLILIIKRKIPVIGSQRVNSPEFSDISKRDIEKKNHRKKKKKKKETFPSISLGVIEKYDKSAAIQISIVFRSMQHVGCRKVLWNGAF